MQKNASKWNNVTILCLYLRYKPFRMMNTVHNSWWWRSLVE